MDRVCLPSKVRKLLPRLQGVARRHGFILAGGTALALQIRHRISVDLDFFTGRAFSPDRVLAGLARAGLSSSVGEESEGTLTVWLDGVKMSMFRYPYPFVERPQPWKGIPLAGVLDIAAMKVIAVCQRGTKRDFVDLYFILQDRPFLKVAETMLARFGAGRLNPVGIGKSLVYFADAEADPEPVYGGKRRPSWETVKRFFRGQVRQMVLDLRTALKGPETVVSQNETV